MSYDYYGYTPTPTYGDEELRGLGKNLNGPASGKLRQFAEARRAAEKVLRLRGMLHRPPNQRGKRRVRRAAVATAVNEVFDNPFRKRREGW